MEKTKLENKPTKAALDKAIEDTAKELNETQRTLNKLSVKLQELKRQRNNSTETK